MPKLSARTIQDGVTAERPPEPEPKRTRTTARKSDITNEGFVRPPCDACHGQHHPKYAQLKYDVHDKNWQCQRCKKAAA